MTRLPTVGGDEGNWGTLLNDYLSQSHTPDGTLKTQVVGAPQLKQNAVTSAAIAPGAVTAAAIPDAGLPSVKLSDKGQAGGIATLDNNGDVLTASGQPVLTSTTLDTETAGKISDAGSATRAALNGTYVPKWKATTAYLAGDVVLNPAGDAVSAIANFTSGASYDATKWNLSPTYMTRAEAATGGTSQDRVPLLASIDKAKTGVWKLLLTGTSISSFDKSSQRVLGEHLKALYGSSGNRLTNLGRSGGAWANTFNGWRKQRYGGCQFTRMRGDSTATSFHIEGNFDRIILEWSREADSTPCEVLIDGVSVGFTGSAGSQAYGQKLTANVALGPHAVTIMPPTGTGYAYLETLDMIDTTRTGVSVFDAGMGGAGIWNMTGLMSLDAGQVAGIPITGTNGLDYYFKRTDVDAFIVEHIVNDRSNLSDFIANTNYAVEATRATGKPILFIIEPMTLYPTDANYQAERAQLLSLSKNSHVTVIDWHSAIYQGDANVALMKSLYYVDPDFTHPVQPAFDVLNLLLAKNLGVPLFPYNNKLDYEKARLLTPPVTATSGKNCSATLNGATKTLATPDGPALIVKSSGDAMFAKDFVYRDTLTVNKASTTRDSIAASGTSTTYGKYVDKTSAAPLTVNYIATAMTDIWTVTLKVSGDFTVRADALRFLDLSGNLIPMDQPTVPRTEIRYSGDPLIPAVISFGMTGVTTSSTNLTLVGRLYDISITKSTVPVLDASAGGPYDFLYTLDPKFNVPVTAAVGTSHRRYSVPSGPAYEFTSFPAIFGGSMNGQVVPYYRDTTVPNLVAAQAVYTDIAASGTSDAYGKYLTYANKAYTINFGGVSGAYRMVTVIGSNLQLRFDTSSNFRIAVNGMAVPEDEAGVRSTARYPIPAGSAPVTLSVVVMSTATTTANAYLSGRVYAIYVTDSTVPVVTI